MTIKTRKDLIKKYIDFFKSKNHKEIPNSNLIPVNDPTVLFTTAGMHPLVPYLLGEKHPLGKRLCNVQKCIRTGDIEEVGDDFHLTFFEMLGNWSLGDYFKKEAIEMSFEFLTKKLNIQKERISVTCFAGDKDSPKDKESAKIWEELGISKSRIRFLPKSDNWWGPAGETGPCGPDTEMFINNCEIWNDVFMQYNKTIEGKYEQLNQKNVDTGMGVERTLAILNNKKSVYETSCFLPIIKKIEEVSGRKYKENEKGEQCIRIIADHAKTAVFIINEGILPGNTGREYVLRRLIRRAIRRGHIIGIKNFLRKVAESVFPIYENYGDLQKNKESILDELEKEERRFEETLEQGLKIANKLLSRKKPIDKDKIEKLRTQSKEKLEKMMDNMLKNRKEGKPYRIKEANITEKEIDNALITGEEGFYLYQSFGFPKGMILDLAIKQDLLIDTSGFDEELNKHQELSRKASSGTFKSGLADNSDQTRKLHTATHLLNEALRQVLKDKNIVQKGSNITPERLRFDFNFSRKLTEEEIEKIENWVNHKIESQFKVEKQDMSLKKAIELGAQAEFNAKYPEIVSVYTIKNKKGEEISKEICTGPHCCSSNELGKFKIIKEESSAAGIRRIKAVLE